RVLDATSARGAAGHLRRPALADDEPLSSARAGDRRHCGARHARDPAARTVARRCCPGEPRRD
ncbi:MAG: hypothetical protein ACRDRE_23420, partial [Pseudonocardiaceae bacterium]